MMRVPALLYQPFTEKCGCGGEGGTRKPLRAHNTEGFTSLSSATFKSQNMRALNHFLNFKESLWNQIKVTETTVGAGVVLLNWSYWEHAWTS